MKKMIALLMVALICAGLLMGCGSGGDTSPSADTSSDSAVSNLVVETNTTKYDIDGLKIEIPSSWRKDVSGKYTYFYSSINQDFVMVYVEDTTLDINDKESQDGYVSGFKNGSSDFTLLSFTKQQNSGFDGLRASFTSALIKEKSDEIYYVDFFGFNYNNKFIQIGYLSLANEREECLNYFPKILSSLKGDLSENTSSNVTSSPTVSSKSNSSKSTSSAKPSTPPKAETPPTPPKAEPPKTPTVTAGQKNALKSAQQYLSLMSFSYSGLVKQLEYEKYSHADATYAADNCGANWNEQAAKSAKNYLELMSFSRDGLIKQLEYEGYTHAQAVYGVNQTGL